jgi:predicted Zn-dependent protease
LRAYNEAMSLNSQGKESEAIAFLEKAVGLDSNFVAAYSLLRVVYGGLGNDVKAREYATKAYELRDRTSERERLRVTAGYESNVLGNIDKAAETYRLFTRMYPKDYISWNGLAGTHRDMGHFEESLKGYQEVLRLRSMPLNVAALGQALLRSGRIADAKALLRKAVEEKRDYDPTHSLLYEIAFIEGDAEGMQRELDWLKIPASNRPPPGDLAFLGRVAEYRKRDPSTGARMYLLYGYMEGETRATNALRPNRLNRDAAITAAMAGEIDGLRALEETAKQLPEDTILNSIDIPTAKAGLELRIGDAAKAVQFLKPVSRFEPSVRSLPAIYIRGLANLQNKSGLEAVAEFQKIVGNRGVALRSIVFPLSHLGLARAYALAGDPVKARKSYEDFFALWKTADADVPILVEARAEYAKLTK